MVAIKPGKLNTSEWATRVGDAVATCALNITQTSTAATLYIVAITMATNSTRLHQVPATTITTGPKS